MYAGFQYKETNYDIYVTTISIQTNTNLYFEFGAYIKHVGGASNWIAATRYKQSGVTFNFKQGYSFRLTYDSWFQVYFHAYTSNYTYYLEFQASGYKVPS